LRPLRLSPRAVRPTVPNRSAVPRTTHDYQVARVITERKGQIATFHRFIGLSPSFPLIHVPRRAYSSTTSDDLFSEVLEVEEQQRQQQQQQAPKSTVVKLPQPRQPKKPLQLKKGEVLEAKALRRNIKTSVKKLQEVTMLIRKMPVDQAIDQLKWLNKKVAPIVRRIIQSAKANAVNTYGMNASKLIICASFYFDICVDKDSHGNE